MITPKLTAVMVVMTALMGATPIAAFAQATNAQVIGDLTNAAVVETGENSQVNAAETTQLAVNTIKIRNEAESGDAEAEGGDAESEAGAEAKSGDAKNEGKYGEAESSAEASALSIAIGGDANAESGDATAVQLFSGVEFDNDVTQTSATVQTNNLNDADAVAVAQTNVPVQTQVPPPDAAFYCLQQLFETTETLCFETEEECEQHEEFLATFDPADLVGPCEPFEELPAGALICTIAENPLGVSCRSV